jgi:serine protease AprX
VAEAIHANLAQARIAPDLQELMATPAAEALIGPPPSADVIIEFNANFPGGTRAARELLIEAYGKSAVVGPAQRATAFAGLGAMPATGPIQAPSPAWDLSVAGAPFEFAADDQIHVWKSLQTEAYLFGNLAMATIVALADLSADNANTGERGWPIHKIWQDHLVSTLVYESVRTIKGDAAKAAFGSAGRDIVWAVADTGVDKDHPHFHTYDTLVLPFGLRHCDFTTPHPDPDAAEEAAQTDTDGHGTHVAGIIAGATFKTGSASAKPGLPTVADITINHTVRTGDNQTGSNVQTDREDVSGIAPLCKILSLKVLQSSKEGAVSNILAAIGYIQQANNYGRDIKIHGLNLSLGYPFDATWFAAGQSPLCVEVNRLVRCGVSVVAAAGNAGYGRVAAVGGASATAALPCTIADPGNADLAVTVGSTHRSRPHTFGVSYFSAKGPTADGRVKPDLVAPGERIVSCQAGAAGAAVYKEDSGTSMAAPHVSAGIAAFLSVRAEFVGRPEDVKAIFVDAAIDLKRRPEFQGAGLIDLMKALQSV